MLLIQFNLSHLNPKFQWSVSMNLAPGVCHRLLAPNGAGKTTFLEELKLQWPHLKLREALGFTDQASLSTPYELSVEAVMDILWDITPSRHMKGSWRELAWWKDVLSWWPRKLSQLSGGENQWVKILMMRSLDSEVWILDEPFQSLDHQRQEELWDLLEAWLVQKKYLILVHHGDVKLKPLQNWTLYRHEHSVSWEKQP